MLTAAANFVVKPFASPAKGGGYWLALQERNHRRPGADHMEN